MHQRIRQREGGRREREKGTRKKGQREGGRGREKEREGEREWGRERRIEGLRNLIDRTMHPLNLYMHSLLYLSCIYKYP